MSTDETPRWSVMIPAYNAEASLGPTLQSILDQDPDPHQFQIEVVDDHSSDATAEIAHDFGCGRVGYHRQPVNVGPIANFNTCIERARGELVHILHADDLVRSGFYQRMGTILRDEELGAAVCRTEYVDAQEQVFFTNRLERATSGRWDNALDVLAISNRVRPPGTVVRRSVYDAIGRFRTDLPHAADWEMWVRIAANYPIWYETQVFAAYRQHDASDTAGRVRTGDNIEDRLRCIEIIADHLPDERRSRRTRQALAYSAWFAGRTAGRLARVGDWDAVRAQALATGRCLRRVAA